MEKTAGSENVISENSKILAESASEMTSASNLLKDTAHDLSEVTKGIPEAITEIAKSFDLTTTELSGLSDAIRASAENLTLTVVSTPTPHWSTNIPIFLTTLVAIYAVYIARCQWVTTRNKLRYDLFDKRINLYTKAKTFIANFMVGPASITIDLLRQYAVDTREAKWLFNAEIDTLFVEVGKRCRNYRELEQERIAILGNSVNEQSQRRDLIRRQSDIFNWVEDKFNTMDEQFDMHLKLNH